MGRYRVDNRIRMDSMEVRNREGYLMDTFPDKEGRTYIQALNEFLINRGSDRGICPKCGHLLDKEGICWRCLTQSNK
jgi:hypothetical protein